MSALVNVLNVVNVADLVAKATVVTGFAVAAELTKGGDGPAVVLTSSRDAADFGPLIAESGALGFVAKAELSAAALAAFLP